MAAVNSTMLDLGTKAPSFSLPDVYGNQVSLTDFDDKKAMVVIFICNHCPYVKLIKEELVRFAGDYQERGVGMVAISSNDVENYPEDSPEKMKEDAEHFQYPFPYLYDETQETARKYKAACTPDLFLFDGNMKLVYRGQFDDSRPENGIKPSGSDLRSATDTVLREGKVPEKQIPSIGCNIKWKKGNEPAYFG